MLSARAFVMTLPVRNYAHLPLRPIACDSLFEHLDALRGRAMTLERNPWDAADLVQDTVVRAMHNPVPADSPAALRAWLMRVMFNLFIDRCRRRAREAELDTGDSNDLPAPAPYRPAAWENLGHEDVRRAMAELEHPFSEVLRLRLQEGRSYREISELLDIPEATVGTRLLRARRKVRTLLSRQLEDGAPCAQA